MPAQRKRWVPGLLAVLWLLTIGWQVYEHGRARGVGRGFMRNRARDISNTLSVVIRSQEHGGVLKLDRLEPALVDLVSAEDLEGVALLNAAGELTVSAGSPIDLDALASTEEGEYWGTETVTIVSLVDLGANTAADLPPGMKPVVISFPGDPPDSEHPDAEGAGRSRLPLEAFLGEERAATVRSLMTGEPLDEAEIETFLSLFPAEMLDDQKREAARSLLSTVPLDDRSLMGLGPLLMDREGGPPVDGRHRNRRFSVGRPPPWMNSTQFEELVQKQGVHWFVLAISKGKMQRMLRADLRHRATVSMVALLALVALGAAWRGAERATALGMKLLQEREMNAHLKDMNLAAAGLAHETKNPLNIVRGLAHYIARVADASEDTRDKATTIAEEVDRVTERLNQFMDYSRPHPVNPSSTDVRHVVADVLRVLETDMEDKAITCEVTGPALFVEADESLLRQVVFNLLLNAAQFSPRQGHIEVALVEDGRGRVALEVRDNGPGIPEEAREEIYRPYYTTSEDGTGLGLAVVRQIVLAHQWEIGHVSRNRGTTFRVSGIRRS